MPGRPALACRPRLTDHLDGTQKRKKEGEGDGRIPRRHQQGLNSPEHWRGAPGRGGGGGATHSL